MSVLHNISQWCRRAAAAFAAEFRVITHDAGVLIFFLALPLVYPVAYTLIYNPEVVEDLPVAVVDECRTAQSRMLVRDAAASPTIDIYASVPDMGEAKRLMASGEVFGILRIPAGYDRAIGRGEQAHAEFYSDMSLLLRYRAFTAALTDLQLKMVNEISGERIASAGLESYTTGSSALPIESEANFLGDVTQGFASFVIPGIVILILQQSMLLGIGMIGGTARERRLRFGGVDPQRPYTGTTAAVVGRAVCYTLIYAPLAIYVMRCIPWIFRFPQVGSPLDYLPFIVPMLLASAFMGQALVLILRQRESVFLVIVFTSVVFLFLSGLTWPRYAMAPVWRWIGDLIPAVWGVEGFISINSNGATLAEVGPDFLAMWILTAVYMLAAFAAEKYLRRRA